MSAPSKSITEDARDTIKTIHNNGFHQMTNHANYANIVALLHASNGTLDQIERQDNLELWQAAVRDTVNALAALNEIEKHGIHPASKMKLGPFAHTSPFPPEFGIDELVAKPIMDFVTRHRKQLDEAAARYSHVARLGPKASDSPVVTH